MKKIAITTIFAALFLTACATSKETFAPDGSKAYSLDCSGSALNWGKCYEKAGEICTNKGYEVVAGGSDKNTIAVADDYGLFADSTNTRSLVIKCKP